MENNNNIIVYRLENSNSLGPYRRNSVEGLEFCLELDNMCMKHSTDGKHPSLFVDFNNHILDKVGNKDGKFLFGFRKIQELIKWFGGYHEVLFLSGFRISSYSVPRENVYDGFSGLQVIFNKKTSSRLSREINYESFIP